MEKQFVKLEKVSELKVGDIIRHISGNYGKLVVVIAEGNRATAVDTWEVTNADEWQVQR